jgi:hypothetical protein
MSTMLKGPLFATPLLDTPLFGAEGAGRLVPQRKTSQIAFLPKRKSWQLPILRTPDEKAPAPAVRGAGGSVLQLPELHGSGRVISIRRGRGGALLAAPAAAAFGRVLARAGGGSSLAMPGLEGFADVDEPELVLAHDLGIEELEDIR